MKIVKCGFSKTFPTGPYYEKIFLEAEVIEGDDIRQSLYALKKQIEQFHFESQAAAEKQMGTQVTDVKENSILKVAELIQQINSCTGMEGDKGLLSFKFVVVGNLSLQNAYDNKYSELNNNNKP